MHNETTEYVPDTFSGFEKAEDARKYWLDSALDEYGTVILLPHKDDHFNKALLSKINTEMERLSRTGDTGVRIAVLALNGVEYAGSFDFRIITSNLADGLLSLYSLYEFTGNFIIGSFDLPSGRKLRNLIDSGVTSEDDLINDVILGRLDGSDL